MNDQGEILDPQGIALEFPVVEYQKTFDEHKVTAHWDVMWDLQWWDDEFTTRQMPEEKLVKGFTYTPAVDYMEGSPSNFEEAYAVWKWWGC